MACDLSKGRREPCKDSVGGIKAFYFANFNASIFKEFTETEGIIGSLLSSPTSPIDLYKYELRDGGHSLEDANEVSPENGTSFVTSTLTAIIKKLDAATREELQLATFGRPHVIVEDYNGNYLLLGLENGCDVQVNQVTGGAMGDMSGYNLTVTSKERQLSRFVDPTIVGDDTQTTVVEGTTI